MVDFSNVGFHDDGISLLAGYLQTNPNLRSITLDNNGFTDDGLYRLTEVLKYNTKLAHLSIRGCTSITDEGLRELNSVITKINTVLFQVDLDYNQFNQELAENTVLESQLNRDIQEKLKPCKIISNLNSANVIAYHQMEHTEDDRAQ